MKVFRRSRLLGLLATSVLGIALLWWLVAGNHIDGVQLTERLLHAASPTLALGVFCFILSMTLSALRYYVLFAASIPFPYLLSATLIQNALLSFLPWRSGEFGYPLLLRRDYAVPIAVSTAFIITVRVLDLVIIMGVAALGSTRLGLDSAWLSGLFLILLGVIAGVLGSLRLFHKRSRHLDAVRTALLPLANFHVSIPLVVLSLAIFVVTSLQSALIIQAMALDISVFDAMLLNALSLLAAWLPIHPPGGWGTIDAIQLVILDRLGYAINSATASILAAHSFYTVLILLGGVLGGLARGRRKLEIGVGHDHVR